MPHFAIAFFSDDVGTSIKVIEAENSDLALRNFFDNQEGCYSKDSEGFSYFKDDFFDGERPLGALLPIEFELNKGTIHG